MTPLQRIRALPTNQRLRRVAQRRLDLLLEGEADDRDRDRAEDHRPGEAVIAGLAPDRVPQPAQPGGTDPDDVAAQEDQRGKHRAHLDDRREGGDVGVVGRVAEHPLEDGQVAGAGDRQELGEPLDRAEEDGFPPIHWRGILGKDPGTTRILR
jgi:hypothetical protein